MCMDACICIHVCVFACLHVWVYEHLAACACVYMRAYVCVRVYTFCNSSPSIEYFAYTLVLKGSDTMTLGWRHLCYISSFINSLSTHEVGGLSVISASVRPEPYLSIYCPYLMHYWHRWYVPWAFDIIQVLSKSTGKHLSYCPGLRIGNHNALATIFAFLA